MNDNKEIVIKFRVNEKENELIEKKFQMSKSKSRSTFIRHMLLDGVVIRLEEEKLTEIYRAVVSAASNINPVSHTHLTLPTTWPV